MISSIQDIQNLVVKGFTDWASEGYVDVDKLDNLLLFNYNQVAQFKAEWNFFERVSRGLIISTLGEIVARSFDKFYNWLEHGEISRGHIVSVTEKLDGSLGILFRYKGGYRITTRGKFGSPQGVWATEEIKKYNLDLPNEYTLLLEIIFPENRVVINYGNRRELVLLAIRNRFTGEYLPFYPDVYQFAQINGFSLPRTFQFNNLTEIIENTGQIGPNEEGYVVEFSDGQRFKFKGDRYLELHRLISGLSFKHTIPLVQNGTAEEFRTRIPEEFLVEYDSWVSDIRNKVDIKRELVYNVYKEAPQITRKDFANWVVKNHKDLAPYLFLMYDGKSIANLVYKELDKNVGSEPLDRVI